MTLFLIILIVFSLASNIAIFLIFRWKLVKAKKELNEESAFVQRELEDQKFKMAEANLKMLEQKELLDEQKFQLAEANLSLVEQKEIIDAERQRSEKLLLNVLPRKVAEELKEHGKTDPDHFENVTVYFSDIVGFTQKASSVDPKVLIGELNEIFTAFDEIIEKNGCERIKTIGDAYLCVSGMPIKCENHADNIVDAAIEIVRYLEKKNVESELKWEVRIGIHTGAVVGGVVGVKKYIYDVFGDTINTASRMEANSEPMKINISETTRKLLGDKYTCVERAPFEVKGKGMLNMFFVVGKKNEKLQL